MMNATVKTSQAAKAAAGNPVDTVSRVILLTMGAISGLVGVWATACLISAFVANGAGPVLGGFVEAILG